MNSTSFPATLNRHSTYIPEASETKEDVANAVVDRKVALQVAYDKYVEQIYRFIFFKVGNREDAEDITSQVFIKAANSLDVTQIAQAQMAWLYQVARTTTSPLHLSGDPIFLGAPEEDDIEPAVEKVRAVLSLLPENYRRVLELRFLQGCSLRETASAMSVTESNAKVIQHRAIQKALKVGAQLI
jgi:RNA polymerase sigma-70 factor, ECF subfamily